jgi:hypothetical protein
MANHLKGSVIQTALAKTAGQLKPGELDDLIDALNRINARRAPDHDRTGEPTLGSLFPSGMNP